MTNKAADFGQAGMAACPFFKKIRGSSADFCPNLDRIKDTQKYI